MFKDVCKTHRIFETVHRLVSTQVAYQPFRVRWKYMEKEKSAVKMERKLASSSVSGFKVRIKHEYSIKRTILVVESSKSHSA